MAGRRAKRLLATHPVSVGFVGSTANFVGELVDLSKTGLLMRCPQDLEPGALGRIGIPMGQEMIRITVAVRRRVPSVGLGFEFIQMGQHDRELLHRLILRLQKPPGS